MKFYGVCIETDNAPRLAEFYKIFCKKNRLYWAKEAVLLLRGKFYDEVYMDILKSERSAR